MTNLVQINKRFTSRSAILAYKVCPYKRLLAYHQNGYGLSPETYSLDLLIGSCVHRGLQHLLEHCRVHHPDGNFDETCVDEAVTKAYEVWNETLMTKKLWLHSQEEERLPEIMAEQECLFEGLIRAFAIKRLPNILEEYDILEVEMEEIYHFDCACACHNLSIEEQLVCQNCQCLWFLGKADGLFLRKADNKIIQYSIKTSSMFPTVTERNILHDMQGVSEQVCTNDRLERWWNFSKGLDELDAWWNEHQWMRKYVDEDAPPKVHAVLYDFLIKGQRRETFYGSGIYEQKSFLVHPQKMESLMMISGGGVSAVPSNYKWKPSKGKTPKGWSTINIWEDVGIKNWVEMLASGKVQPELGDPFLPQVDDDGKIIGGILHTPNLVIRSDREIEEWKVSTRFQEETIAKNLTQLEQIINSDYSISKQQENAIQELVWKYFPKNTLSCHDFYGKDCEFVPHCHELMDLDQMEISGKYQPRFPHHDLEKEEFVKKGYIEDDI